jgi:predicted Rossmann fold flavoprotein
MKQRLIVIGGGAAGFFCAVNAAAMNPSLEVIILEKSSKVLSKVKVSGGGRCNVTHACFSIPEMIRKYPRGGNFLKKVFHRFFTSDTIKWFNDNGVVLKTEQDGRMFPVTDTSQTIIDCLIREVNKYGIQLLMNADVKTLTRREQNFELLLGDGRQLVSEFVCVASGGYPKSGMFDWLKRLGHSIAEPVPSLFTFNMPGNTIASLMGVTVEKAVVKIAGTKLEEEGPLLITHWGMSGPVILRLSAWGAIELQKRNYSFTIFVNWLPGFNENSLREKFQQLRFELAAQKIINRNPFYLPQRLWEYFIKEAGIKEETRWADLPGKEQNKLIKLLCAGEFEVKGKTTFKEEFVTAGGIQLSEVDADTMMSKLVPGLFFAGEVLNVDGITGGFNFQHAWSTGYIAATSIAGSSLQATA